MKTELTKIYCERCEKDCDEVFECERCGTMMCSECQAEYNQFSQIDFNCCKSCAEYNSDDYENKVERAKQIFFQAMEDYITYTITLRYRMRMKKKPIKRKEILNRLNNR